jgi:type VII secretion-associated serine protease mycosin
MAQAHQISKGAGQTVAVIDTGAFPHPDLRRNLLAGTTFIAGEDGDGLTDRAGHGTHMAALVAAHGRGKNKGILGIAPEAKVLPVKISDSADDAPADEMAQGIDWAVSHRASVINVSAAIGPSFKVEEAVAEAIKEDIVVVASVGNAPGDLIIGYPAAFDGVLAVGSTGPNGKYSGGSVKDDRVQICAPGEKIATAELDAKYVSVSGTSPAAALVSGAVALVRAKFPKMPAAEVIHRLTATADDIGNPGRDPECGFGRLNIVKALTADVPPLEGGGSASSAPTSGASSAAGAVRPEFASPGAAAAAEPASSSNGWLWGGLAGAIAAVGVIVGLVLRRRRTHAR